jgi:hypothetical protein
VGVKRVIERVTAAEDEGRRPAVRRGQSLLFILPFVISIAFFLIADLDSPRGGMIRVHPQNLLAASQSIKP